MSPASAMSSDGSLPPQTRDICARLIAAGGDASSLNHTLVAILR